MNEEQTLKLREILLTEFNEPELQALCQTLGLDYATLPGEGHFGKTRAIFLALREQGRLPVLRARIRDARPAAYAAAGLNTVTDAPESSANLPTQWAWLILGLMGLLLILCAITWFTRPTTTPAAQSVALPQTTATQPAQIAPAATSTQAAAVPVTPAVAAEATLPPAPTDTPIPVPTPTAVPLPTRTPTVSETHPAALALPEFNQQLIPYFAGQTKALPNWRGAALTGVIGFSKGILLRRLSITEADRGQITTTIEYLQPPTISRVLANGNTVVVVSREYWTYSTNPRNIACETRDYTYTMVKSGNTYQVTQSTSKLISAQCK
jgi:hypothetical protein